jgi:putative transferase (TIGR04331 family)
MELQGRTDCEAFILAMIPKHLPVPFVEGYRQLSTAVSELPWPKRPRLIFTSSALWHDTVSMAYTAEKVTQGTPLVYGQHGGMSGDVKFNFGEEHEVAISDRYLSWGWDTPAQPKVKPVGILKPIPELRQASNLKCRLLLVTFDAPRYSSRLFSGLLALTDRYYDDCLLLAEALPESLRSRLLVRHTSFDHGRNQGVRWSERFPGVEVDSGVARMDGLLRNARLAVYTYNSTGHLEAFAQGIPTVLFWDPEVNPLRDSAVSYFNDLRRVGILHDSPESAADHVAAIWNDVDGWWASLPVQEVLERFKARYCRLPENLLDEIEAVFSEVTTNVICQDDPAVYGTTQLRSSSPERPT